MILHQIGNSHSNFHYNAYIYQNSYWEPHFHKSFELVYVMEGAVNISVNGIPETLGEGELILLCPYTIHSLRVESSRVWVGVFSEDFVSAYAEKYKQTQYMKCLCDPQARDFLGKHLFVPETPERYLCISCLNLVCHICSQNARMYNRSQNSTFISDVISYVSRNIGEAISMREIAAAMNYEYHYFSTLFNQAFSMNFKSFTNLLRIENACAMLMDNKNSITKVSETCGFGSIRNFNRVFKGICGCAPQEFRRMHLK